MSSSSILVVSSVYTSYGDSVIAILSHERLITNQSVVYHIETTVRMNTTDKSCDMSRWRGYNLCGVDSRRTSGCTAGVAWPVLLRNACQRGRLGWHAWITEQSSEYGSCKSCGQS